METCKQPEREKLGRAVELMAEAIRYAEGCGLNIRDVYRIAREKLAEERR